MDRKQFGSDVKRGAAFTDWRKDGKVIFFVHPQSDIQKRITVTLRRVVENDDGEEEIRGIRRFYLGDTDISNQFLLWLKNDATNLSPDDTVLRLRTAGGDEEEYLKGELLGMKGYDWRKRLMRPRTEYLFCIVNVTEKGEPPKGPEVLVLPYSAGKKLNKVWDEEIEELGEDEGDPWINPYACKVTFDQNERGTDMYGAGTVKRPLTPEVRALFDQDAVDMSQYVDPDSEQDSDAGTTADLLRAMCVVDCPILGVDVETEKPARKAASKPKTRTTKTTKTTKKPAPKKQEPKPPSKPSPPSKPGKPKTAAKPDAVDVEDAEPGAVYMYDGDEITFVKWDPKKKRGIATDEDGLKVPIPAGEELIPVGDSGADAEDEDGGAPEPTRVTDCVKGRTYYTQDGDKLQFVRYNHSKEKGVFQDPEGERVFLDGEELVSEEEAADSDPLEPRARKEPTGQTKPKAKSEPQQEDEDSDGDDGDDMEECPACDKLVASDASVCPHCGAEFEEEDEDEVPFD